MTVQMISLKEKSPSQMNHVFFSFSFFFNKTSEVKTKSKITPLYKTMSTLFPFLFLFWRSFLNIVGDEELLELAESSVISLLFRCELPGELFAAVKVDKLGEPKPFLRTFKVTIPLRILCQTKRDYTNKVLKFQVPLKQNNQ